MVPSRICRIVHIECSRSRHEASAPDGWRVTVAGRGRQVEAVRPVPLRARKRLFCKEKAFLVLIALGRLAEELRVVRNKGIGRILYYILAGIEGLAAHCVRVHESEVIQRLLCDQVRAYAVALAGSEIIADTRDIGCSGVLVCRRCGEYAYRLEIGVGKVQVFEDELVHFFQTGPRLGSVGIVFQHDWHASEVPGEMIIVECSQEAGFGLVLYLEFVAYLTLVDVVEHSVAPVDAGVHHLPHFPYALSALDVVSPGHLQSLGRAGSLRHEIV